MQQELQIQLTKDVFRHLDAKTTHLADDMMYQPVTAYTDPEILAREKLKLFRQQPQFIGLSCLLTEPGSYLTLEIDHLPILVTRNRQGVLKAFLNVCRHRGARIANGCGQARRAFVCPYHGWTYDHDGRLIGVPFEAGFPDLERQENGLVALPVVERDGMIWLLADPKGTLTIDQHLQGLEKDFVSYNLDRYHHYETRSLVQKMNWKAIIDTFLEPYHFAVLHAGTVGPIFIPNLCLVDRFGPNLREVLPRRSITDLREIPEQDWDLVYHTALVYVLFPNTVFVMQSDHVETWRVFPHNDNPGEAITYLDFYIPEPAETESAKSHWDRNMDLTIRTVADEDFPTGEGIHAGYSAGAQSHVKFGRNEPALIHFQQSIAAALAE